MIRVALVLWCLAMPATAQVMLELGPSQETFTQQKTFASYEMPVGPAGDARIATVVAEGALSQKAWEVAIEGTTTLRIMDALRQGLEREGFEVLYECETRACGGFDFRFGTQVIAEPAMHVDLGDFRYLAVQRLGQAVPEYLSLLVSRSIARGYVQMIHVGPSDVETSVSAVPPRDVSGSASSLQSGLEQNGVVILDDLVFETGSSQLGGGPFASLGSLAEFLESFPERRVILVGHTDAEGSLEGNISLSRKRAQSVVERLVASFGVSRSQVQAEGVGYLSPVTNNLTDQGRTKNRRVEAILASTQ